jgi:hypothetical protein
MSARATWPHRQAVTAPVTTRAEAHLKRTYRALRVRQGNREVTARDGMRLKSLGRDIIYVHGRHQRGTGAQDGITTPAGLIRRSPWLAWRSAMAGWLPLAPGGVIPCQGHLARGSLPLGGAGSAFSCDDDRLVLLPVALGSQSMASRMASNLWPRRAAQAAVGRRGWRAVVGLCWCHWPGRLCRVVEPGRSISRAKSWSPSWSVSSARHRIRGDRQGGVLFLRARPGTGPVGLTSPDRGEGCPARPVHQRDQITNPGLRGHVNHRLP